MFPHRTFHKLFFIVFWIVSLLVNWPLLSSIIFNTDSNIKRNLITTASLHLFSCILIFLAVPKRRDFPWYSREQFWAYTLFLICFFLPLFGHAIVLALFLFHKQPAPKELLEKSREDEDLIKPQFTLDEKFDFVRNSAELKKKIGESVDFLPLTDIMAGDDVELKRGAVEKLIQYGTKEAIETLLTYRNDASPDVRFFVTSALTRYKKTMDEELEAAKLEMKNDTSKVSIRILLAKLYIKYIESKLLDEISCNFYLNEAKINLIFAVNSEETNEQAFVMLLDVHERLKEWGEADNLLKQMKGKNLISQNHYLQHCAKINYETKNFPELIGVFREFITASDVDREWSATAHWWGVST